MENYRIEYSPLALDDLVQIYQYIAWRLREPVTAEKQIRRIRNEIRSLEFFPGRYRKIDGTWWDNRELHKMPVDNYIVYYLVSDADALVMVARIFYGGRDADRMFRELDEWTPC